MIETDEHIKNETISAIFLSSFGGYEKIQIQKVIKPSVKVDSVVVEMKACGMNFSDIYTRQGIYTFHGRKPPFILGLEGAGLIFEVGTNVTEFKVMDRVLCWSFVYGMWSEFVELPSSQCYPIPENMSFEQAACIIGNYVTAFLTVMDFGNLRPGQNVLIQSAAGGVGWAATQIAKTIENVTVFGTSSPEKHDVIKENGVTHPIDYRSTDFVEEVLKISPTGVNVILDCLSGTDFMKAQKCLKYMGRIIHVGISSMISGENRNLLKAAKVWWQTKNVSVSNLINKNHAICGINIASLFENDPDAFKHAIEQVMKLFNDEKIKPRIDSVWSFDEVIDASKRMVERKNIGKIILVPKKENITEN